MHILDGTRIARLDPAHPSLTAFEVEYKWKGIQEQDVVSGIYAMFILTIIWLIILFIVVVYNYNRDIVSHKD